MEKSSPPQSSPLHGDGVGGVGSVACLRHVAHPEAIIRTRSRRRGWTAELPAHMLISLSVLLFPL